MRDIRYSYSLPVSASILIVTIPAILAKVMLEGWLQILVAASALVLGSMLRLSPLSLIVVCLAFDFGITWPIGATLNLAIFAIPLLAVQTIRKLGQESPHTKFLISGISLWFGAFLASVILSVALNEVEMYAVYLSLGKITIAFIALLLIALQIGTGESLKATIDSFVHAWMWVAAISLLSGFLGLALWDFAEIENNFQHWGQGRVSSGFQNPNNFGLFQLISLGLAIFALHFRGPRLLIVPIWGATLGVLLSGSQTALISLAVVVALGLALTTPRLRSTIAICLGTLAGFATFLTYKMAVLYFTSGPTSSQDENFVPTGRSSIEETVQDFSYTSTAGVAGDLRWKIWEEALEIFRDNPVVGIGLGQFQVASEIGLEVHKSYLQILAEGGVIMWVAFFGPLLFATLVSSRRKTSPKLIPMIAGLGVFAVGSTQLHSLATWVLIAVFLSVLAEETWKEGNDSLILRKFCARLSKTLNFIRSAAKPFRSKSRKD